jgi:hypothetical protein
MDSAFLSFALGRIYASRPSPAPQAIVLIVTLMVLITIAARLFPRLPVVRDGKPPGTVILFIVGFVRALAFFFTYTTLHQYIASPALSMTALFCLLLLFYGLLLRLPDVPERGRVALAAGAEGVLIVTAIRDGIIVPAHVVGVLLIFAWFTSGRRLQNPQTMG